jgi:mono/diheme cytochrome c family protein
MRSLRSVVSFGLLAVLIIGCGDGEAADVDAMPQSFADASIAPVGEVPAEPQRPGDPEIGYHALVNEGYVSCGVPSSLYDMFFAPGGAGELIPGREGKNATLPYSQTAFTTASGVEVVSANCLICHAGRINGELVIGLGAADADYTTDPGSTAELAGNFIPDSQVAEKAEWRKWADRVVAIAPYTTTTTVGVNPADNIAAVLFAHRDPVTMAWSNEPLLELPPLLVIPADVPPWWRMKKKNAMFYDGAGRGDHARIMMSASTLCTDSVAEAEAIDAYFPDVAAYLKSIEPPVWPWPVDDAAAARGKILFDETCAECHGTYGATDAEDVYPNLVIAIEDVDTDATIALGAAQFAGVYVEWFNRSFYGLLARLQPAPGYYAPPLDGIWATAPFLHNGSVPTLALLLESTARPRYWTRSFDSNDYDQAAVGWSFTAVDHGQDDEPNAQVRKRIYDTSQLGYGNAGHTYGDALTAEQRTDLLEYLKTL